MGECVSSEKKPIVKQQSKTKISNPYISKQPLKPQQTNTILNVNEDPIHNENAIIIPQSLYTTALNQPNTEQKSIEKLYRSRLKQEVMGYVTDLPNSLYKIGTSASKPKLTRLSKQVLKFAQFLPCQHTNAIFVRCDQSRMDSMNVLISGSKGTPYANGLYHYELYCHDLFPGDPPKMQLLTGKNKVRFNPNLYINGYICLSLLGTWPGQPQQTWNPLKSSLAQIFVSVQSIIMTSDIYFNEPGYEGMRGSPQGKLFNEGYSNVVKIANIRHAMIQIIKKPPKGFQSVVRKHFFLKKNQILQECSQWLNQKDRPFQNCGQNPTYESIMNTQANYGSLLLKEIQELKSVLATLTDE